MSGEDKQEKRERGKRTGPPPIGTIASQFASFGNPAAPDTAADAEPTDDILATRTSKPPNFQQPGMVDVKTSDTSAASIAEHPDAQIVGRSDDQTSERPTSQPLNNLAAQITQGRAAQPSERLDVQDAHLLKAQEASRLSNQPSKALREDKREREPQTIYLPPEKRTRLHIQAAIERRELSLIVEHALDLYYASHGKLG